MIKEELMCSKLLEYNNCDWEEITIGCSDTQVFKISKNNTIFLKVGKEGLLTNEYNKLRLLDGVLPVPKVINYFKNNGHEYLITSKMSGKMSCEDDFIDNKPLMTLNVLVDAIMQIQKVNLNNELKMYLQNEDLDDELKMIKQKIDSKELAELPDKKVFEKFKNVNEMYEYLINNKPMDELIFSHGDVSLPNVFIDGDKLSGFIDIGNAGIRQKWYDIADCYVSVRRNFESQEMADKFLNMLGITDKSKVEYYEMLISLS